MAQQPASNLSVVGTSLHNGVECMLISLVLISSAMLSETAATHDSIMFAFCHDTSQQRCLLTNQQSSMVPGKSTAQEDALQLTPAPQQIGPPVFGGPGNAVAHGTPVVSAV
jgi:hypothetical protein